MHKLSGNKLEYDEHVNEVFERNHEHIAHDGVSGEKNISKRLSKYTIRREWRRASS